jgi:hypothetical protein
MTRTPTTKDLSDAGVTRIVMPRTKGEGMTREMGGGMITAKPGAINAATTAGLWSVKRSDYGYPVAIVRNGWDILHLEPSMRTVECVGLVVQMLNGKKEVGE